MSRDKFMKKDFDRRKQRFLSEFVFHKILLIFFLLLSIEVQTNREPPVESRG